MTRRLNATLGMLLIGTLVLVAIAGMIWTPYEIGRASCRERVLVAV